MFKEKVNALTDAGRTTNYDISQWSLKKNAFEKKKMCGPKYNWA